MVVIGLLVHVYHRLPRNGWTTAGLVCLLGVSVGYLGAVAFPCDPGCPAIGGGRQLVHNLAGLTEYLGALVGLSLLSAGTHGRVPVPLWAVTLVCTIAVAIGFLGMGTPGLTGASQRLADYSIFAWLGAASLWPLTAER